MAKPGPAIDPNAHEYLSSPAPDTAPVIDEDVKAYSAARVEGEKSNSSRLSVRFAGMLALLIVALGGLIYAVTQNSVPGIAWMAFTTAIAGVCFYLALQEFSHARPTQHH